jgi:ankyrin repeat protein
MSELTHQGAYRLIHVSRRTGAESAALRAHLQDCEECRRHAAMAAVLARKLELQPVRKHPPLALREFLLRSASRSARRKQILQPFAAAGALAMLAVIVYAGWSIIRTTTQFAFPEELAGYTNDELISAMQTGDPVELEHLLALLDNSDYCGPDGTALLPLAARSGQIEAVRALLARGANVDATMYRFGDGSTALMEAALNNRLGVVDELIAAGVDVNQTHASNGLTALYYASGQSNLEIVQDLLEHGADPNLPADNGATPLSVAARNGYVYTVRALLEAGADVNLPDNEGITPLMAAIIRGRVVDLSLARMVTLLLLRGADPNQQDKNGNTALHHAVETSMIDAIPILIEYGASLEIANNQGQTPLDLAKYGLTAETLRAAAAKVQGE